MNNNYSNQVNKWIYSLRESNEYRFIKIYKYDFSSGNDYSTLNFFPDIAELKNNIDRILSSNRRAKYMKLIGYYNDLLTKQKYETFIDVIEFEYRRIILNKRNRAGDRQLLENLFTNTEYQSPKLNYNIPLNSESDQQLLEDRSFHIYFNHANIDKNNISHLFGIKKQIRRFYDMSLPDYIDPIKFDTLKGYLDKIRDTHAYSIENHENESINYRSEKSQKMMRNRKSGLQSLRNKDPDFGRLLNASEQIDCSNIIWGTKELNNTTNTTNISRDELLLKYIYNGNVSQNSVLIPQNRQYLFGLGCNMHDYPTNFFRIKPAEENDLLNIYNLGYWSQGLNNLYTYCATKSPSMFPVRFVTDGKYPYRLYNTPTSDVAYPYKMSLMENYKFIATLSRDIRTKTDVKQINVFLFCKKDDANDFIMLNFYLQDLHSHVAMQSFTTVIELKQFYQYYGMQFYIHRDYPKNIFLMRKETQLPEKYRSELRKASINVTKSYVEIDYDRQMGGSKNTLQLQLQLRFSDTYTFNNTLYYEKNIKFHQKMKDIEKKADTLYPKTEKHLRYAKYIEQFYKPKYEYTYIISSKKSKLKKYNKNADISVKNIQGKQKNILVYDFNYAIYTLPLIEIYNKTNFFMKKHRNILVLASVSNNYIEFLLYTIVKHNYNKYAIKIKNEYISELIDFDPTNSIKNETNGIINNIKNIHFEIEKWNNSSELHDIVFCNSTVYKKEYDVNLGIYYFSRTAITQFYFIVESLKRLNDNGNLVIQIYSIIEKYQIEIIFWLEQYFESVKLEYADELYNNIGHQSLNGVYLVCKNFKRKMIVPKDLAKHQKVFLSQMKDYGLGFSVNKCEYPEVNDYCKSNKNKKQKYLTSIVREGDLNDRYNEIYKESMELMGKIWRNILNYYDSKYEINNDTKLMMSIKWCIDNNINYIPIVKETTFTKEYYKYLYQTLIINNISHDLIPLKMSGKNKNIKLKTIKTGDLLNYDQLEANMRSIETSIDYLDEDDYKNIGDTIDFYRKSLTKTVTNEYGGKNVTQAWLKMYEILSIFGKQFFRHHELKSFHCCELPGSFIYALEHYLKTHHPKIKWEWKAQSLNPKKNSRAFRDQFNIVKKHNNKYNFGVDCTGDITSLENIKYYKGINKLSRFFTADCGVSHDVRYNLQDRITYSILLFMLCVPQIESSFVCKLYLPLKNNNEIMLFYLIYAHYEKVELFKPKQNTRSTEFYLIGINKNKDVSSIIENKLMSHMMNINNKDFDASDIPMDFQLELYSSIKKLCDNYVQQMIAKISFVKLFKSFDDKILDKLKGEILKMPTRWIKYYGLKKYHKKNKSHVTKQKIIKNNTFNKLFAAKNNAD